MPNIRQFFADKRSFWGKWLSVLGIRQRFLLIFVLLVMLPTAIFIITVTRSYYQYALDTVYERQSSRLSQSGKGISSALYGFRNNSLMFYYNESILDYVNNQDFSVPSDDVYTYLDSLVNSEHHVLRTTLLLDGADPVSAGQTLLLADEYVNTYKNRVMDARGRPVTLPTQRISTVLNNNERAFAVARAINSPDHPVGSLWIFISADFFDDYLEESGPLSDNTVTYLMSPEDGVIASSLPGLPDANFEAGWKDKALSQKKGHFVYRAEDQNLVITSVRVQNTNWQLVAVTPRSAITQSLQHILTLLVAIFVLYILFIVAMYLMLSKMLFQPITRLGRGLRKVSHGDFAYKLPRVNSDEISELTDNYNEMISKIQSLMDDVREHEQAKNRETIKVLSMQIGSHFLYNTLNTIRWMAVMNKQTQIRDTVVSLTKLLMSVTYHTGEEISLREELTLVRHYSMIQKVRFVDFEVQYNVPEELLDLQVGKLLLQPVIENCIVHGFNGQNKLGTITITAMEESDVLLLSVSDNGQGFDPSLLDWHVGLDEPTDHVGLRNIHQRLKLNYGPPYGLSIQSQAGMGTTVVLQLPVVPGPATPQDAAPPDKEDEAI